MKKAQTEIMGLIIIVILIVFIGLIALRFMAFDGDSSLKDTTLSIKANNLINALTKVEIDENSFKENVYDCCTSSCSATFVTDVENIIQNSLEGEYSLIISREDGSECSQIGSCNAGISSSKYFLRQHGEKFDVRLIICN